MTIYTTLQNDDIVPANPTTVTTGLFSGDTGSFEGLLYVNVAVGQQTKISGEYYFDVYNIDPGGASGELAEVQFALTYGHINGGGSPTLDVNEQSKLPTKAIYSQYRNLLLNPEDTKFSFQGVESDHIYVINFQRSRIREQLDPGNWELPLSGANGIRTFIDDSGQTLGALTANSKAGRVYNIISGALSTISGSISSSTNATTFGTSGPGYGLVYPDLGIIVLNPNAIGPAVGFFTSASSVLITGSEATSSRTTLFYSSATAFNSETSPFAPIIHELTEANWSTNGSAYNHTGLFVSIRNASNASGSNKGFRARSAETIASTHYFVRLRNKEYNYSNNPTFSNASTGVLVQSEFKNDPKVYITTIGLYNDSNELLAVAKLSKPVRKSFDEEVLLRVRLDF
jgi:hypothetical protein